MKKITFFIHNMYKMGGTERVVSLIANRLSKEYEVEIISLHKEYEKPFYKIEDNIKIRSILGKELQPIKLYYPYLLHETRKFLKNYHTDVFICAGMGDVGLTIFMHKRCKYIAWEHFYSNQGKVGGVMWFGRVLSAKYADNIVVLTKKDMEINIKRFKTLEKVVQIYNPFIFKANNKMYDINSKKIVSCGRFTKQKGYDMLIDVAEKVFSKHPDWIWDIYGDGEEMNNIKYLIERKHLENNVILKGRTNKMDDVYREYAMFVLTSRFEGFAMVNIEAHNAKLPIVSFNCNCGPDEIIQEGINGYLIECFDIDKMAEKINYLIENSDIRLKMSNNTMLDKEKLMMENVIDKWKEIL